MMRLLLPVILFLQVVAHASTMPPRWFQRSPMNPSIQEEASASSDKNATTTTGVPSTLAKPYWLQKAMNNTKTTDDEVDSKKQKERSSTEITANDKDAKPSAEDVSKKPDDTTSTPDTPSRNVTSAPPTPTGNSNLTAPVRHRPIFRPQHQLPAQPGRIIVLGGGTPQQRHPGTTLPQHDNDGLVGVLGQMAIRAVRLGILTWLSQHLMHREETIVPSQQFVWEVVNEKHDRDVKALKSVLQRPPHGIRVGTWRAIKARFQGKPPNNKNRTLANLYRRTVIVIEMSTFSKSADSHNIQLEQLTDIVNFLTQQQKAHAFGTDKTTGEPLELEVVFCLESPGGSATLYGKAAAELVRFKQSCANLLLTVCVDQIAASGGYMMASQADRIVAAPFAIVGSIGVIREGFNFYELAKRYGIQPLVLKSGDSKNPVSAFGPITRQDMELEQVRLKKVHRAFQDLVIQSRPQVSARIMDGSIFSGGEAYDLGLIDDIQTSAEYIFARVENGDRVLRLHRCNGRKNMRNLSVLDLLPHLQSFVANVRDPVKIKAVVRLGTWIGLAHHLLQSYQIVGKTMTLLR